MTTQTKWYLSPSNAANTVMRGDSGRIASLGNHRLYRQGRNYKIRVGVDPNSTATYAVFALRNDWMIHQSWKLAFEAYMNNNKEELDMLAQNGGRARWLDFRTEFTMTGAGDANPVVYSNTGVDTALTTGEFVSSVVTDEAGNARTFRWGAASSLTTFNPIEEYQDAGNTVTSPTTVSINAPYQELDDDLASGQLGHLSGSGNEPPYDADAMESLSPWVKVAVIGGVAGTQNLSTGYFHAPCGLFYIVRTDGAAFGDVQELFIEYAAGDYKGLSAPTMGTAKLVKNHYEVK